MTQVALSGGNLWGIPVIGSMGLLQDPPLANQTQNAAGESYAGIGYIQWNDGATHTVSSAGGKIYWQTGAVTYATVGTTNRIGIQDVDTTTGLEDGTFDVHDDLAAGTDTVTANAIQTTTMSSGSKSIAHGALIAVVIEMTARAGADSIQVVSRDTPISGLPYITTDTGGGPAKTNNWPVLMVEADDGAVGVLSSTLTVPSLSTITSFNSGSATDEYALIFQVPVKCTINRLLACIGEIDTGETGEIILYSTPTGTPVAERTVSMDPDVFSAIGNVVATAVFDITEFELAANTTYAVAYKATSAGNRNIRRVTSFPAAANTRKFTIFGTTLQGGTRADATGAFSASDTDFPALGFVINKLEDGTASGGGGLRLAGRGGLAVGA